MNFEQLEQLLTAYIYASVNKHKAVQDINHLAFMLQHEIEENKNEAALSNTRSV